MRRKKIDSKLRRLVWELYGNECSICGEADKKILQVHHISGDASDNEIDNLMLVCVWCHALCFHIDKIDKMLAWVENRIQKKYFR